MKFCTRAILLLSLSLSLVTIGCEKKDAEQPAEAEAAVEKADEAKPEAAEAEKAEAPAEKVEKLEKVEVPAEGKKFDPPVELAQLPEGAWHCDMGTAHWAAMENTADGRCPECNMKLQQYTSDKAEGAADPQGHDDHAGHDH